MFCPSSLIYITQLLGRWMWILFSTSWHQPQQREQRKAIDTCVGFQITFTIISRAFVYQRLESTFLTLEKSHVGKDFYEVLKWILQSMNPLGPLLQWQMWDFPPPSDYILKCIFEFMLTTSWVHLYKGQVEVNQLFGDCLLFCAGRKQ